MGQATDYTHTHARTHTHTHTHTHTGTFAVVELMIGNAVQRTLTTFEYTHCLSSENYTDAQLEDIPLFMGNGTADLTCGLVKRDIAITLALMTGLIMVGYGVLHVYCVLVSLMTLYQF